MHKRMIMLLLVTVLIVGSGCARASRQADSSGITMTLTAIPYPPHIGTSRLVIQVADEDGSPIDDARLSIKGDMTHAGMIPVLAEVNGGEAGVYEVPLEWTMAGDWVITIDLSLADGRSTRQRFDLAVQAESGDICEEDEQEP